MSVLEAHGITVSVGGREGAPVLGPNASLVLPAPGCYVLEGDNQSGKSTLIRFLTGCLPGAPASRLLLSGCPVEIASPQAAQKAGIGAVFQDDRLIPHLRIKDLYRIRWTMPAICRLWGGAMSPRTVLDRAAVLLESYGAQYLPILEKRPVELSGGALAVARLVLAQLNPQLRILLLDEAFNGVQRDVWPVLVAELRTWAASSQATILAVTHSADEVEAWGPVQRFCLNAGRIHSVISDPTTVR